MFGWATSLMTRENAINQGTGIDMFDLEYFADYLPDDMSDSGDGSAWIYIVPGKQGNENGDRPIREESPKTPTIPPTIPSNSARNLSLLPVRREQLHPILLALRETELQRRKLDKLRFRVTKTRSNIIPSGRTLEPNCAQTR